VFRKALDRYTAGPGGCAREALMAPTARAVAERLLYGAADLRADGRNPPGCLLVQGALSCGDAADPMRQELSARRAAGEAVMRQRFERAQADGDPPADTDPADLARYVATVIYGMAVQAAGGASREELRRLAEVALRAWPSS
jgi:hypothetical protein